MWEVYQKAKIVLINGPSVIKNYLSSINVKAERFEITIKDRHLKKLIYIKEMSSQYYLGLDNLDEVSLLRKEWLPAKITHDGVTYDVDIRIKGQSIDHWGDYPSFKVKVKGDNTILGMKRFAIQHPSTRGFMNEWFFHQFLNFNNLIALRYNFIIVSINGDKWPIFALEENFAKRLIENNKRREGLIFRISYNPSNRLDFQESKSKIADTSFEEQANIVKKNIDSFFHGKLQASDIFDINQLARYFSIIDLWGNHHAAQLKNVRFYYNPITLLIEPIGYDEQLLYYTQYLNLIGSQKSFGKNLSTDSHFFDLLFNDIDFYKKYLNSIEELSNPKVLDSFFQKIETDYTQQLKILYKSYPYFEYKNKYPPLSWFWQNRSLLINSSLWLPRDKSLLYDNQDFISNSIKLNDQSIVVYYDKLLSDKNKVVLKIKSREKFPIEVTKVTISEISSKIVGNNIIQAQSSTLNDDYSNIKIKIPPNITLLDSVVEKIVIKGKIAGTNQDNIAFKISNIPTTLNVNFVKEYSDLSNYGFLNVNNKNKIITIKQGDHILKSTLIIPPGYELQGIGPFSIKLINNAKIISYSPINLVGKENNQIKIFSDSKSQGIAVMNSIYESNLEYVEFNGLSHVSQKGWALTGAVTFYESNVNISNCTFVNSNSEDALNIIRSQFKINDCSFINSRSDGLDIDFSDGQLINNNFINNGNDGLDISGAKVEAQNIFVNISGDKGISIGENSYVHLNNITVKNSNIAIASKDKSIVYIDSPYNNGNKSLLRGVRIENCNYGFAVYQKKSEFGPAEVHLGNRNRSYSNITIIDTNEHFLVEKKSFLTIGKQNIITSTNNVFETIYNN